MAAVNHKLPPFEQAPRVNQLCLPPGTSITEPRSSRARKKVARDTCTPTRPVLLSVPWAWTVTWRRGRLLERTWRSPHQEQRSRTTGV